MKKKIVFLTICLILGICCIFLNGCSKKADAFSVEEHIHRVTERIENKYMTKETNYTSFSVYPLYSQDEELKYFLVEFEPYGFVYIMLRDEAPSFYSWFGLRTSMYSLSSIDVEDSWIRYTFEGTNSKPCYELDKNGNNIYYNKSPFAVAKIENERRYLLCENNNSGCSFFVPAIKKNDKFINLISMEEFTVNDGCFSQKQPNVNISFIANKSFDL